MKGGLKKGGSKSGRAGRQRNSRKNGKGVMRASAVYSFEFIYTGK